MLLLIIFQSCIRCKLLTWHLFNLVYGCSFLILLGRPRNTQRYGLEEHSLNLMLISDVSEVRCYCYSKHWQVFECWAASLLTTSLLIQERTNQLCHVIMMSLCHIELDLSDIGLRHLEFHARTLCVCIICGPSVWMDTRPLVSALSELYTIHHVYLHARAFKSSIQVRNVFLLKL